MSKLTISNKVNSRITCNVHVGHCLHWIDVYFVTYIFNILIVPLSRNVSNPSVNPSSVSPMASLLPPPLDAICENSNSSKSST